MAQFTVQGRLKPLFNGDGMLIGFEPKDPRHHHRHKLLNGSDPFPLRFYKRKLELRGSSSTGLSASSSSSASKSYHFNSEASSSVGNDGIYDDSEGTAEFERDELSCFRGLVFGLVATFSSFLFGYHLGVINDTLESISMDLGFSGNTIAKGLVVSTCLGGAFVGSLFSGWIVEEVGCRRAFQLCALPCHLRTSSIPIMINKERENNSQLLVKILLGDEVD